MATHKIRITKYVRWFGSFEIRMCYVCAFSVGIGRLFFVTVLVTQIAADRCRALLPRSTLDAHGRGSRVVGGREHGEWLLRSTQYAPWTSIIVINYGMRVMVAQCTTHE